MTRAVSVLFFASVVGFVVALRFALRDPRARWWHALAAVAVLSALWTAPRGYLLVKSVGALVMPLGLLWLTLGASSLGAWWRGRRSMAAILGVFWVGTTLVGSEPLADALVRWVEAEHARARPLEQGPFDAVIVLGGGTSDTPAGEAQLGASGDRVMLGARLYRRGVTRALVTSGAPIAGLSEHDSARAASHIWQDLGVPRDAIELVSGARTTGEEAQRHARLIRERGWARVGLVTSAVHMRRALANFRALGVEVTPLPADVRGEAFQWRGFYSLIPRGPAAADIHDACWEIVGRLAGR